MLPLLIQLELTPMYTASSVHPKVVHGMPTLQHVGLRRLWLSPLMQLWVDCAVCCCACCSACQSAATDLSVRELDSETSFGLRWFVMNRLNTHFLALARCALHTQWARVRNQFQRPDNC